MRSEVAGSAVLRNITPRGPRAPGRPRGRGHWQPAGPTCLVRAVLVRVPAGPRRSPTQPRRHTRPAADGAAPSPAAAKVAGARAPALPPHRRRQEAAEPVPFHGSRPGAPPRGALLDTARISPAALRSAPLLSARPQSASVGPVRLCSGHSARWARGLDSARSCSARRARQLGQAVLVRFRRTPRLGSARLAGSGAGRRRGGAGARRGGVATRPGATGRGEA